VTTKGGGAPAGSAVTTEGGDAPVGSAATTKGGDAPVGSAATTKGGGAAVGSAATTKGGGATADSAVTTKGGGATADSAVTTKGGGAAATMGGGGDATNNGARRPDDALTTSPLQYGGRHEPTLTFNILAGVSMWILAPHELELFGWRLMSSATSEAPFLLSPSWEAYPLRREAKYLYLGGSFHESGVFQVGDAGGFKVSFMIDTGAQICAGGRDHMQVLSTLPDRGRDAYAVDKSLVMRWPTAPSSSCFRCRSA
jgi:hypothetical protein